MVEVAFKLTYKAVGQWHTHCYYVELIDAMDAANALHGAPWVQATVIYDLNIEDTDDQDCVTWTRS